MNSPLRESSMQSLSISHSIRSYPGEKKYEVKQIKMVCFSPMKAAGIEVRKSF